MWSGITQLIEMNAGGGDFSYQNNFFDALERKTKLASHWIAIDDIRLAKIFWKRDEWLEQTLKIWNRTCFIGVWSNDIWNIYGQLCQINQGHNTPWEWEKLSRRLATTLNTMNQWKRNMINHQRRIVVTIFLIWIFQFVKKDQNLPKLGQ